MYMQLQPNQKQQPQFEQAPPPQQKIYLKPGTVEYQTFIRYIDMNFHSGNSRNICATCWLFSHRHQLVRHKQIGHRILTPRNCKDELSFQSLAMQYNRIKFVPIQSTGGFYQGGNQMLYEKLQEDPMIRNFGPPGPNGSYSLQPYETTNSSYFNVLNLSNNAPLSSKGVNFFNPRTLGDTFTNLNPPQQPPPSLKQESEQAAISTMIQNFNQSQHLQQPAINNNIPTNFQNYENLISEVNQLKSQFCDIKQILDTMRTQMFHIMNERASILGKRSKQADSQSSTESDNRETQPSSSPNNKRQHRADSQDNLIINQPSKSHETLNFDLDQLIAQKSNSNSQPLFTGLSQAILSDNVAPSHRNVSQ